MLSVMGTCLGQAQEAMALTRGNFRKDFLYFGDLYRQTLESPGHIVATVRKQSIQEVEFYYQISLSSFPVTHILQLGSTS